jgi:RimJ/RimL family protein N-acetyltransferase
VPDIQLSPFILEGPRVRLDPLEARHLPELGRAIEDGSLWEIPVTFVPRPDDLPEFLAETQRTGKYGVQLPFVTIDKQRGQIVGSTRFMNIHVSHRRVEIGYTFLGASAQRTHVNTEAKYLMLKHAFEVWGVNRVELLTDFLNSKSRNAIARIGGKQEGILRSHMVMRDGRIRDTVVFGITVEDWPGVKAELERRLGWNSGVDSLP